MLSRWSPASSRDRWIGLVMLAIQAYVFFGSPPISDKAAAMTAIIAYVVLAVVIRLLERRHAALALTS